MSRKTTDTTLRDSFLERIKKPGCPSVKTIAEEMNLPKATLYSWIAAERQRKRQGVSMSKKSAKRSALTKFILVAKSEGMTPEEREKFCAENGVSFAELQSWRDLSLSAMENSGDGNVMPVKQREDEVSKLKAELARKEKALAEAAALLILQKNFGNIGTGKVEEEKKRKILAAVEETIQNGARLSKACDAIGICERRYRRWRRNVADNRGGYRENNLQRLSQEETASIIENFTGEEYRNLPLNIAHAKLMDQGIYIASRSTCERVMKAYYQGIGRVVDRNIERRKRPEYAAKGPNQVWCWDITRLHSEVTGKYYYLYLIIDMYSRYIVGWSLHTKEDGKLAEMLFAETLQKHRPGENVSLLVHADNGKPMRSKDLKSLFEKLHVISSHSRPHTSNDNAFAESVFLHEY